MSKRKIEICLKIDGQKCDSSELVKIDYKKVEEYMKELEQNTHAEEKNKTDHIKIHEIWIEKDGGLYDSDVHLSCNCVRNESCSEYEHEMDISIYGYFKGTVIYKYILNIYQDIDMGDVTVMFSEPKKGNSHFTWNSNFSGTEYWKYADIFEKHFKYIKESGIFDKDETIQVENALRYTIGKKFETQICFL